MNNNKDEWILLKIIVITLFVVMLSILICLVARIDLILLYGFIMISGVVIVFLIGLYKEPKETLEILIVILILLAIGFMSNNSDYEDDYYYQQEESSGMLLR